MVLFCFFEKSCGVHLFLLQLNLLAKGACIKGMCGCGIGNWNEYDKTWNKNEMTFIPRNIFKYGFETLLFLKAPFLIIGEWKSVKWMFFEDGWLMSEERVFKRGCGDIVNFDIINVIANINSNASRAVKIKRREIIKSNKKGKGAFVV